jgi:hypothetical protein
MRERSEKRERGRGRGGGEGEREREREREREGRRGGEREGERGAGKDKNTSDDTGVRNVREGGQQTRILVLIFNQFNIYKEWKVRGREGIWTREREWRERSGERRGEGERETFKGMRDSYEVPDNQMLHVLAQTNSPCVRAPNKRVKDL